MDAQPNSEIRYTEQAMIVTRTIDSPRELVWKAWTEPRHFTPWWGPDKDATPFCKLDVRVGGRMHYCVRLTDSDVLWGTGIYQEVNAPEKFVVTDSYSDGQGNAVDPTKFGKSADWPLEAILSVRLEERDGKTTLILEHGLPSSVPDRDFMAVCWIECFDRLENYLKTM